MKKKESKSIEVDFAKVMVHFNFEGEPVSKDFRKMIGNLIRNSTGDIGLNDFAKKIYYSEGPIEVPDNYISEILRIIKGSLTVPTQEAFALLLTANN